VQRLPELDLALGILVALDQRQILHDGALVRHPAMDTTTTRVDPEQVLEAKVLAQRRVQHLDGRDHETPALVADGGTLAARADVVVVRQVDIEHELALLGHKVGRADLALVRRGHGEDGADVDLEGQCLGHGRLHLGRVVERLVADVRVVLERERQLPPEQEALPCHVHPSLSVTDAPSTRRSGREPTLAVGEPPRHLLVREQAVCGRHDDPHARGVSG